jgi:hypothetical protein
MLTLFDKIKRPDPEVDAEFESKTHLLKKLFCPFHGG